MNRKTAISLTLWLLLAILVFHLSIILKIVPYDITWGGRLKNEAEMYAFETISIVLNLILFLALLIKRRYLREFIPIKIVNLVLWTFLVLFTVNTVGNILAETNFEKFFGLITSAFVVLLCIILRKDNRTQNKV